MSSFGYPVAAAISISLGVTSLLASFVPDIHLGAVHRLVIASAFGCAALVYLIKKKK